MVLQPQRLNIPITGGLSQDETPEYLDPPALYQCDNFYHRSRSSLTKRNGYDTLTPIVDSRNTTRDMTVPLLGDNDAPIDRFIDTGSTCTFAARGYLWTYDPLLYSGATTLNPKPNTIRHCEIPDLQIIRDTVVSIDGASASTSQILDAVSANSLSGIVCVSYLLSRGTKIEWHLKIIDANGSTLSDTIVLDSAHQLMRPCIAAYNGGFVASVLNFNQSDIYAYQYQYSTMAWTSFTWPQIDWGAHVRNDALNFYDMVGTGNNTIIVTQCIADCWYVLPGWLDAAHEWGTLIEYTIDASTGALINGPIRVGKTDWNGTQGPWPIFACAGDNAGNYATIWFESSANATKFKSFSGATINSTITVQNPGECERVGLGLVTPTNSIDSKWNMLWQLKTDSLEDGYGHTRSSTYSAILSSTQSYVGYVRAYYGTQIGSNPFCVSGGSYALLIPDLPFSNLNLNYSWGDTPWVLTRTWNDQWRGDPNETTASFQTPMGVWGYGTTFQNIQPFRINSDLSSTNRKGFGAVVVTDVFNPLVGTSVVNLKFDPTGPDRYDSAPIPGGGAIFGCAQPWIFDGTTAFEAAFIHRPILISDAQTYEGYPTALFHKDVADDSYHYFQLIYEHADERGRITRSPVSETYKIKIREEGNNVTLRIANINWNARKPNSVQVKVYMSRDAINYAFAGAATCPTYDNTDTPDDVYVTLKLYPGSSAPMIYTSDGTIESGYPQLAPHLARWNNRVWIADENTISYSQAFVSGDQVSFPDVWQEALDIDVSALAPLDDRMLLFSPDAVMYRSGEGPAPNGQGSSYSNWIHMTHEVGCVNSRSVLHSMVGTFFQSRRGMELMDAAGNFVHQRAIESYFNARSEQGYGDTIVGTLSLPRDHQARFLYREKATNQLKQLVFDYSTGTWSRWSGTGYVNWWGDTYKYAGDITVVGNQVYMATIHGCLYVEANGRQWDQSTSTDSGVAPTRYHIDWAISSPWIKAEGLQGYQRVWRSTVGLKCQSWTPPQYVNAPNAQMGLSTTVNIDYSDISEVHPSKSISELQVLRNSNSSMAYVTIGHKYQQCRSYQINLSGKDTGMWTTQVQPSGVTEIMGLWSEFGIETGTGRGQNEGNI
jgi:hypothetical protein